MHIIDAYAAHFLSLPSSSAAARCLTDPARWCSANGASDHLPGCDQELVTTPAIFGALNVLLVCFASWEPTRVTPCSGPVGSVENSMPSPAVPLTAIDHGQRIPGSLLTSEANGGEHRAAVHSHMPSESSGPIRFNRYIDMSRDQFIEKVRQLIAEQVFDQIGHPEIRLEGQTAWGVWLRVNHWSGAMSRRPRLRCGVLYHVANRTLSFHGGADVARRMLLPIFADWTFSSLHDCPSMRPGPEPSEADSNRTCPEETCQVGEPFLPQGQSPIRRSTAVAGTATSAQQTVCPVQPRMAVEALPGVVVNNSGHTPQSHIGDCPTIARELESLRREVLRLSQLVETLVSHGTRGQANVGHTEG